MLSRRGYATRRGTASAARCPHGRSRTTDRRRASACRPGWWRRVLSGLHPAQAIDAGVTDRLAIVTAVMLGEAADRLDDEPEGVDANLDTPAYRRYAALDELLSAMAERKAVKR